MTLLSRKPREKDTREVVFDARPPEAHVMAAKEMLLRLRDPILEPRTESELPDPPVQPPAAKGEARRDGPATGEPPVGPSPINRLDQIATLVRLLTYGEMMDLSAALWEKREPDSEVTEKELPGIFHRWSTK